MIDWLRSMFGGKSQSSPGSRDYAREMLAASWEAYRLARRDRPREHFQPQPYSGDAAIIGSHDMMNRRVRDIVRNTAQGKRITQVIVDLVIGSGMQTYSWPFAPSELLEITTELDSLQAGELGPRLQFALESDDAFEEWFSDPEQFDVEGRLSGHEAYRMLLGETIQVGNGLLIRSFAKDFKRVPLKFQLIEREQLDETKDRPSSQGRNKIVGGIEFNARNQAVAYHLYADHPFDDINHRVRRQRIPAERVIDLALYHRPSASLGASWYDASGQSTWDRDSYIDSEIRAAAADAVFSFVAKIKDAGKHGALGFDDDEDNDDEWGNTEFKLGHSPIASLIEPDESLEMVRQTRPNKDAPTFLSLIDRDTAAAHGISYYSLTGDYEKTNFSSSRAAKLDEEMHLGPLQDWFGCHVALPVRREFNAIAAATGQFSTVRPAEFRRNERRYQRFDVIGAGRELLDPFKEGEARTARLRTGISTYKEECARRGIHWIRQLMQIAIEKRVQEQFGVDLDFSKGGGVASDSQPEQQQDDQEMADRIADRVALLMEDTA